MDNVETEKLKAKGGLRNAMAQETKVMRSLLDNIIEEQHTLLENHTEDFKATQVKRQTIMEELLKLRHQRITQIDHLSSLIGCKRELIQVVDDLDATSCEILSFRDQLLALYEKVALETQRNNYLIENKVALTKKMIQRLYPSPSPQIYKGNGMLQKPKVATAVTLINQEG